MLVFKVAVEFLQASTQQGQQMAPDDPLPVLIAPHCALSLNSLPP